MRVKNTIDAFSDFKWEDLAMSEQLFNDFRSKYLDLWQKTKTDIAKEKVSILNDVDFELELLHRDEINVTYILKLLHSLGEGTEEEQAKKKQQTIDLLSGEASLKSKQLLIEKFIEENLPHIEDADLIREEFEKFWSIEQQKHLDEFIKKEQLSTEKTTQILENYLFSQCKPLRDELLDLIDGEKPSVLKRKSVGERILHGLTNFVETFFEGI